MMKRLTEKRIAEILNRAEVCDDSVLTDYADIAAAMREILDIRKQNELLREELELRIADAKLYRVAFENADVELQERRKAEAVQSNVNIKPFTREQLITEAKQAVKGCERMLRISPDVEAHKISLRMAEIALAALTEQPTSVVHHGWKLVPQEPTDEMIEAMHGVDGYWEEDITSSLRNAIAAAPQPPLLTDWQSVPKKPTEEMSQAAFEAAGCPSDWFGFDEMYSAAIAVAPQPPVNDLPGGGTGEEYLDHLLDNPK